MTERLVTEESIDDELPHWRQGDVSLDAGLEFLHLADLACPHSPASIRAVGGSDDGRPMKGLAPVAEEVEGVVVLTQTCDIVRSCKIARLLKLRPS